MDIQVHPMHGNTHT